MEKSRLCTNFLKKFEPFNFTKIQEERIFLVGSISIAKEYFYELESILQIKYHKLVSICSVDGLLHKSLFSDDEWDELQDIALRKLKFHDAILVLDVNDYIGEQSREEINYVQTVLKKPIYYLSKLRKKEET
ncbi:MAG: hypothetical protein BAJALOKI1v1_310001 [Promethearchaeota archaeon]|nr:MAG: hypothetical protein BAJALOKI1v1_310001 [Candidatus Lokiarchaeota archaeon]